MRITINPVMYIEVDSSEILDDLENTMGGSASGDANFMTNADQLSEYAPGEFNNPEAFKTILDAVEHNKFDGDIILYC